MPAELKLQKYNPYHEDCLETIHRDVFKKQQLNGSVYARTEGWKPSHCLLLDVSKMSALYLND